MWLFCQTINFCGPINGPIQLFKSIENTSDVYYQTNTWSLRVYIYMDCGDDRKSNVDTSGGLQAIFYGRSPDGGFTWQKQYEKSSGAIPDTALGQSS